MRQLGWVKDRHGGNSDSEEACLGAFKGSRTPSVSLGDTLGPGKDDSYPCREESKTQV